MRNEIEELKSKQICTDLVCLEDEGQNDPENVDIEQNNETTVLDDFDPYGKGDNSAVCKSTLPYVLPDIVERDDHSQGMCISSQWMTARQKCVDDAPAAAANRFVKLVSSFHTACFNFFRWTLSIEWQVLK